MDKGMHEKKLLLESARRGAMQACDVTFINREVMSNHHTLFPELITFRMYVYVRKAGLCFGLQVLLEL